MLSAPGRTLGPDPVVGALLVAVAADALRSRRIVRAVERDGHAVVAGVAHGHELPAACAGRRPHIAVLAWAADRRSEAAATRRLAADLPRTRLVVVLPDDRPATVHAALAAGADGLVVERRLELVLPSVLRSVAVGQASVPRRARGALDPAALSHREREVLALASAGLSNADIARRMCLAESTVKSHLASAFSKLGVRSREEATALVLGALPAPAPPSRDLPTRSETP
jgi:DNA-binding NarL/FixJ family response regulator